MKKPKSTAKQLHDKAGKIARQISSNFVKVEQEDWDRIFKKPCKKECPFPCPEDQTKCGQYEAISSTEG